MVEPRANPEVVRFGLYELNLETRELRKSGVKIKLQEKPFLILALLLERPGAIVTREELQKRLWPKDTFVDFDLGLNSAVKKLRQTLNDDSENPRFVETLYRRGYRFIGQLDKRQSTERNQGLNVEIGEKVQAELVEVRGKSKAKVLGIVAAAIALIVMAAAAWYRPSLPPLRIVSITQITHDNLPKDQIVTDGPRLYFRETLNDHEVLSQVSAEGGEVAQVATPFTDVSVLDLSPSSAELLVEQLDIQNSLMSTSFAGPLWSIPLPAGSPRRLGDLMVLGATLSPDGKDLVFGTGKELKVANPDGSNARRLVSLPGYAFAPRFSPDGTRLRFSLLDRDTGSVKLWEATRNGGGLHPLLPTWHQARGECCGNWTPDGKYFVFMALGGGIWASPDRVGILHRRSSEPQRVTNGPLGYSSPVPSRDGRKLFVVGEQPRAELLKFDGHSGQFRPFLSGISAGQLDFSPDGQSVTYVTYPDGAIWRSCADGSERRQLTYAPLVASMPRWSPDGKQIAFSAATSDDSLLKAFIVSADGGTPREVLRVDARDIADVNWSPDGNALIFSRSPVWGSADPKDFVLEHLDLNSGKVSDLPGSAGLYAPRWSPDGKYIAALTPDQDKVMLTEVNSREWKEVASGQDIEYPNWSRHSATLFFESTVNGERTLFRVEISNHRTERVLSLAGFRRPSVPFGVQWSGVAQDDSTLIMRDVGIREIYALTLDLP